MEERTNLKIWNEHWEGAIADVVRESDSIIRIHNKNEGVKG